MHAARDQVFRALADPTRRAIFESLSRRESPVGELTSALHVSQPAVSQHLAVLREAGLVALRQDGRQRFYSAEPSGLAPLLDWLEHHRRFWNKSQAQLKSTQEELE